MISLLLNSQEKIPIEEVFEQLKCTKEGLTSQEGADRLQIFGPNKLEEKKVRSNLILSCLLLFAFLNRQMDSDVTGKQVPQVSRVHVESPVLGHGDGRHHGHRPG